MTPETLHFSARDLKPYAEPVDARDLKEGQLYFSLGFLDEDLVIPTLAPVVFIGNGLESGEDLLYFQDAESYREGIRYGSADAEMAVFTCGSKPSHIYEYENALNQLLLCSLRRSNHGDSSR